MDNSLHPLSLIKRYTDSTRGAYEYAAKEKIVMMGKASKMLLFFYVLSMFKPVMPLITDMIAHTFWEQEHLMQVHEVQGQFHIHQQLADSLHQSDKQSSQDVLKYEVDQYLHTNMLAYKPLTNKEEHSTHVDYSFYYPVVHQEIISPPPQLLL